MLKENRFFGIFKKLTVCLDLVPKSLYLFFSDSSNSANLYSVELRSAHSSIPKGKLNFFVKIRSFVLNFAFLSSVDRLGIFSFLKKSKTFFYNDLGAQRVIACFCNSSKKVGIFLDAGKKKDINV